MSEQVKMMEMDKQVMEQVVGQKSKEEPVACGDAHAEVGCGLCARNGAQ